MEISHVFPGKEEQELLREEIARRKQVEQELRKSEAMFSNFMRYLPGAVFMKDGEGRYIFVNKRWELLVQKTLDEVLGKMDEDIWPADVASRFRATDRLVIESGNPQEIIKVVTLEDGEHHFLTVKFPIPDSARSLDMICGIAIDVTAQKLAERELVRCNNMLKTLIQSAPLAIIALDGEGKVIQWIQAAERLFGWSEDEVLGRLLPIIPEDERERFEALLETMLSGEKLVALDLTRRRRDDSHVDVSLWAASLEDADNEVIGVISVLADITERKRANDALLAYQEQLRCMASRLMLVEARERRRIAEEIHDHLGQKLALAEIRLGALRKSAAESGYAGLLDEIRGIIREAIQSIRSLTFELCPPILHSMGFKAALESLAEKIEEQHFIQVEIEECGKPQRKNDDVHVLLYFVVRELMVNVIKHARAAAVKVVIDWDDYAVCVTVKDDGVGFDVGESGQVSGKNSGFGLFSIRERLSYIKGNFKVESEPGAGTLVTLYIPLNMESEY